jgi:hypothetical protein
MVNGIEQSPMGSGVLLCQGGDFGGWTFYMPDGKPFYSIGIDESADVGTDENTPVLSGYKGKEKFMGKIEKVTVETFPK